LSGQAAYLQALFAHFARKAGFVNPDWPTLII